jgi:hypothetical protein
VRPFYRELIPGEKGTSGGSPHAPSERATEDGRSFRADAAADRRVSLRSRRQAAAMSPSLKTSLVTQSWLPVHIRLRPLLSHLSVFRLPES